MRPRHNKKRNTAFLYEVLVREAAKTVMSKDFKRKAQIISLMREHFNQDTELAKEMDLYKALHKSNGMDPYTGEKLIQEVKKEHEKLDQDKIFFEQSALISKINKTLSKKVFSNFVPNYKSFATIAQIFNTDVSAKNRVLLETKILKRIVSEEKKEETKVKPISKLAFNVFVKKFNEAYGESLLKEQRELLNNYIMSFSDNSLGLKIFLTKEIDRLRESVQKSLNIDEIKSDSNMSERTKNVLNLIEEFKNKPLDKEMVNQVLKIQNLVKEIQD